MCKRMLRFEIEPRPSGLPYAITREVHGFTNQNTLKTEENLLWIWSYFTKLQPFARLVALPHFLFKEQICSKTIVREAVVLGLLRPMHQNSTHFRKPQFTGSDASDDLSVIYTSSASRVDKRWERQSMFGSLGHWHVQPVMQRVEL